VWFSCGAASACAAKLAIQAYGESVSVVYCDLSQDEHPSNLRFRDDVSEWLGVPVTVIKSSKFDSVEEVWRARSYMAGIRGAPCTGEMKKIPRFAFQRWDDIHVFGMTAEEGKRIQRMNDTMPELSFDWLLFDAGLTKNDCFEWLLRDGLMLPEMYHLGYNNNNCIGCVKATSAGYWTKIRADFPDVFERRVQQSRSLGVRLARYKGKRLFLDELPAGLLPYRGVSISCGPDCH
tara:strand:- start:15 stop:716 length:702 start_codon:yes stop_codon:yes gene_type:complete